MLNLHICQSGVFCGVDNLDEISEHLSEPATITWLDLENPTPEEVALLSEEFNFHPLAIEDAVHHHERPKIEPYDGYYLIVFYAAEYGEDEHIKLQSINLFVGSNYIVSIRRGPVTQVNDTIARWHTSSSALGQSVSGILHALLDDIVDDYFTLMDQIIDWIEELEDSIFSRFREGTIEEIFALKKDLLMLRRVVAPERDVLNVLLRQQVPIFKQGELAYVQDVYDHLVRVTDSIDTYRDLLSSARDSYLSLQANQLNQLVKTLTLSSIILMACALIAGIYGMNFAYMPELSWPLGYPFALGLMAATGLGLALFFKSRKWW